MDRCSIKRQGYRIAPGIFPGFDEKESIQSIENVTCTIALWCGLEPVEQALCHSPGSGDLAG